MQCKEVVKDKSGEICEVRVELVEMSKEEEEEMKKKVKGYIHWLACKDAIDSEARLYEPLFSVDNPNEVENFLDAIEKDSLKVMQSMKFNKKLLSSRSFFYSKNSC